MADTNGNGVGNGNGLSPEFILQLMSGGKVTKGTYEAKLMIWLNDTDEPAIDPQDMWPVEFSSKKASSLYQGFLSAVKDADLVGAVTVKKDGDKVYLLSNERCAIVQAEVATAQAE